jgi:hypothetical protein
MVTIPSPVQQGAQTGSVSVDAANEPFRNVNFAAPDQQLGQDLQNIGNSLGTFAGQIAAKRDRVNLRAAEAEWYSFEREISDPQSGLYTQRGINASGTTDRITTMTDAKRAEITERYEGRFATGSGKEALDQLMAGRSRSIWNAGASFEMGQLDQAEQAQYAASVETAADRASTFWNDDAEYENAISQASGAALGQSEGQGTEAEAANLQAQTSSVVLARANKLVQNAPNMVEQFMQREVDAGRMDQTAADDWLARNETTIINGKADLLVNSSTRASTSPFPVTDPVQGSPVNVFLGRLIGSESSGRADASVTIDDGRTFSGLGGVGEARLQDMKNAGVVPQDMTLAQFSTAENADTQRDGLRWAIQDIDRAIDATGALSRGFSRDGLRAVAHIGGKGGMRRYISSNRQYNPDDSYTTPDGTVTSGTSLQDYYDKFAGQDTGGMTVDQRINAETDPQVRDAAEITLNQRRARQATADARLSGQVTDAIITDYEASQRDNTEFDLSAVLAQTGVVEALGSNIENVRAYVQRQETGADIVTDNETVQMIENLIVDMPQVFRERDLIAHYGNDLSNSAMTGYLREQSAAKIAFAAPAEAPTAWTRAGVKGVVDGFAAQNGVVDAAPKATLVNQMMDYTRQFSAANNGARLTDAELRGALSTITTSTVPKFDPTGRFFGNTQSTDANFQDILDRADAQGVERFFAGEIDMELTYTLSDRSVVNHKVTADEFATAYDVLYTMFNAPPLASQVITALQLHPPASVEENN